MVRERFDIGECRVDISERGLLHVTWRLRKCQPLKLGDFQVKSDVDLDAQMTLKARYLGV